MSTHTLSIEEFSSHLGECGILLMAPMERYMQVVIRGSDGDYAVAAVHMDKQGTLIFDMGRKLED